MGLKSEGEGGHTGGGEGGHTDGGEGGHIDGGEGGHIGGGEGGEVKALVPVDRDVIGSHRAQHASSAVATELKCTFQKGFHKVFMPKK